MAKKFKYSEEDMKSALADINSKVLSLNKSAAQYGIPKSTLLFTEDCITVQYDKESKSTEDNLLYYINETENNVRINYVEVNTSTEEDILLPTEIENYNMVKYGKENLSTKDNLLYIDINETENKIVNEETEDSVSHILTNDQEHLITNKNRNYESKSIDEAWEKHLFWPKPDNIDLNKKNKQPRLKLPYAVSAKQWREHHSKIEQAKLQKEEELCLKIKHREEIKNAKLNESSQKIKKKPKQKKIIKKSKKHSDSSENDADCLYCNEPYSLSKSGESWIKCCSCAGWAHELCARIEKTVAFICDMCR